MQKQLFFGILLGVLISALTYFALGNIPVTRAAQPHPAIPTVNNRINAKYLNGYRARDLFNAQSLQGHPASDFVLTDSEILQGAVKAAAWLDCRYDDESYVVKTYFNNLGSDIVIKNVSNNPTTCSVDFGVDMHSHLVVNSDPQAPPCSVFINTYSPDGLIHISLSGSQQDPCLDSEFAATLLIY